MEVIEVDIRRRRSQKFRLYPLGDIHTGSVQCSEEMIQQEVQEIAKDKDAFWLGMGDYADCITKDDKRFDICGLAPWVERSNIVESQRKWLKNLFEPIKGQCIGLLAGNHEQTILDKHQNDLVRNLCSDLGVRYGGYQCFVVLKFHRSTKGSRNFYTIHAWHGAGAAQTEGARLMRLMRLVNEFQADIYLMGHLHTIAQYTPARLVCDHGKIKAVNLIAAITGSWLKGYAQPHAGQTFNPSYVEQKGYKPNRLGCPVIEFDPEHNDVKLYA